MPKNSFAQQWGFDSLEALISSSTVLLGENKHSWLLADAPRGGFVAWFEQPGGIYGKSFTSYDEAKEFVVNSWRAAWCKDYLETTLIKIYRNLAKK